MKLGIISDEVSQDFDRVVAFAKKFDLNGIEVRSVWEKGPHLLSDEEVDSIGEKARNAGLEIAGVATPTLKVHLDKPEEIEDTLKVFARSVEIAKRWKAPMIRVFTGWRVDDALSTYPQVAQIFREKLLPAIAGENMVLGIENEYSTNVGSAPEVLAFFKELGETSQATLVWDPCNVVYMPTFSDPLKEDLPQIIDLVGHFHVKDARRIKNAPAPAEPTNLGDGEAGIEGNLQALHQHGYNGWVSLETHWRLKKALSEDITHLPAGSQFSAGGEEASALCMERLKAWVDALA